jgi:hypothetical protein
MLVPARVALRRLHSLVERHSPSLTCWPPCRCQPRLLRPSEPPGDDGVVLQLLCRIRHCAAPATTIPGTAPAARVTLSPHRQARIG